jgi:homogentisate 1,2-dioxygenase
VASILRRGRIPVPPTGLSEYIDQAYSIKGFFGPWAHLYRRHNPAHVVGASNPALIYQGLDTSLLRPTDADDPAGEPLVLLEGDRNSVALSCRRQAAPFAERNVDRHQIRFYHQGAYVLHTEFGALQVGPGDFTVIPAGIVYREVPVNPGDPGAILILESEHHISLAEELWDKVGFAGMFVDYSGMELASPSGSDAQATPTRVRVRFDGRWEWLDHAFDPTQDVIGWLGDPMVFKMNVWDVPGIGTTHNFLTPPANAVLFAEDYSFFFNILGPRPGVTVPPPNGSVGAPAHLNDYDEVWFKHASEMSPESVGDLWNLPRTITHPGLRGPAEHPPNPPRQVQEMNINFDTKAKLRWTTTARAAWFPDPQVKLYTSLYGAHVGVVPEVATALAQRSKQ